MFPSTKQKIAARIVFAVYLILLVWLILFKFETDFSRLSYIRTVNLVPFGGCAIVNGQIELREIMYNILVFIPFGVYLSVFFPKKSFVRRVGICLALSLCFEVLQFILAIGASDSTDLIDNTIGGILGIFLCAILHKLMPKNYIKSINILGGIIELFAILLLLILFAANS